MKRLIPFTKISLTALALFALFLISSCKSDDDPDPEFDPIGSWTTDNIFASFLVDEEPLEDYILDNGGSQADVDETTQDLISLVIDILGGSEGEMEITGAGTYAISFEDNPQDSGTWIFDETTGILQFTSNSGQPTNVTILSPTTMVVEQTGTLFADINEDEVDEEIELQLLLNFRKS